MKRRNMVSRRFTPRAASAWEDDIRGKVTKLLDAVRDNGGSAEVINEMAAPLPAMMIGKLLGFEEDDWPKLKHWSETTIALGGGPRYFNDAGMISAIEFAAQLRNFLRQRSRAQPMIFSRSTRPLKSTAVHSIPTMQSLTRCYSLTVGPRPREPLSPGQSST